MLILQQKGDIFPKQAEAIVKETRGTTGNIKRIKPGKP
jgi:hypothetical protein